MIKSIIMQSDFLKSIHLREGAKKVNTDGQVVELGMDYEEHYKFRSSPLSQQDCHSRDWHRMEAYPRLWEQTTPSQWGPEARLDWPFTENW